MSNKLSCPGCGSHTSGVYVAVADGAPCPHCGLAADAIITVHDARRRAADADLLAQLEAAVVRAGRAEAEAAKVKERLRQVIDLVAEWRQEDEEDG